MSARILAVAATTAVVGVCAVHTRAVAARDAGFTAYLYASDYYNSVVNIYDARGRHQKPIAQITNSFQYHPMGLTTDALANLWVVSDDAVQEYPPGGTNAVFGFGAAAIPYDAAFGPDGLLYLAAQSGYGYGYIKVYEPGSLYPKRIIRDSHFRLVYGDAFDASGNLYVSYYDGRGRSRVSEFRHARPPGHDLGLTKADYFGIAFDASGDLVAANFYAPSIDVFLPGATMPSFRFGRRGAPWYIAFDLTKTHLFVADYKLNAVEEYSYPEGKLVNTIAGDAGGGFVGVAVGAASSP